MDFIDSPSDEGSIQELQSALKQLAEKDLPDEARAFFLAELYLQYGQNTKALEQIEYLLPSRGEVECVAEGEEAIKLEFQEVKSELKSTDKRIPNLLTKVQALRSYDPCGKHGCAPDQRAVWSKSQDKWICVGC